MPKPVMRPVDIEAPAKPPEKFDAAGDDNIWVVVEARIMTGRHANGEPIFAKQGDTLLLEQEVVESLCTGQKPDAPMLLRPRAFEAWKANKKAASDLAVALEATK